MRALTQKLWRDLRLMWSQALTIALVVAGGIGGLITTLSAVDSLAYAREQAYAQGRFADLFASLNRAPLVMEERLRAVPGVAEVQTSIEQLVRIELPGTADPVSGRLIGIDARRPPRLNQLSLRQGLALSGMPASTAGMARIDVLVSEGFARVRGLESGSELGAVINGRHRRLSVIGIALSPEHVFATLSGMPDVRGYGVFWMDAEQLAAAYDMRGAFNQVAIKLAPGASRQSVSADIQRLIASYGGRDVYGREEQSSHRMLDNEIKEQHVLGSVLTSIFVAVAAFLLNVVITRLVAAQREQIATLKAIGYDNTAIGLHYMQLVLVITLLGFLIGLSLGKFFGAQMVSLYAEFFRFPVFEHRIAAWLLVLGLIIAVAIAVLGSYGAVTAVLRLAPAEAMRPPAPGHFRRTLSEALLERLSQSTLPPALSMILRNMQRRPWRAALSVIGTAAAIALVIMGNFVRDSMEGIVDSTFRVAMRADVLLWTREALPESARLELARLPGAIAVEAGRDVAVRLTHGHRSERVALQGYAADAQLRRIVDVDGQPVKPSSEGLILTDRLASKLGLGNARSLRLETLEGRRIEGVVPVAALIPEMMGLNAYMERRALNRLLREGELASQFSIAVERGREGELLDASKSLPQLAGAFSKATMWRNMREITARNISIMSTAMTLLATIIAIGVVYNNARIALAERAWELASLRVLGFTRAEVSGLLLGEMAIAIALALPLGMLMGKALVHLLIGLLASDQFQFPVLIQPRTYAWAAVTVLLAASVSAVVVRRRIDRLDMVAALKTRE